MAGNRKAFRVGLFVLVGLILAVIALVWLGISDWFREKKTYVTYFDVSVQGLNVDSQVKFRGVQVGKVREIQVAPDNYLIEVVMDLDPHFTVGDSMRTKLGMTGITGMKYIEMNYVGPEKLRLYPKLSFNPPYQVIPSYPGGFEEIEQSLRDIYAKLIAVDTEGISLRAKHFLDSATSTMDTADSLLQLPELTEWAVSLNRAVTRADSLVQVFDSKDYDARIDTALTLLQDGARSFRDMTVELKRQAVSMRADLKFDSLFLDLGDLIHSSQELVNRSQYATLQLLGNLEATTSQLNMAIDQLNSLIMSLDSYPSNILYTAPPPKEK